MDKEEQKPIPRIRTYETDIEMRKRSGISPFDVVAKGKIFSVNGNLKRKNIILISILLVAVGGGIWGLSKYFFKTEEPPQVTTATQIGLPYIKADLETKLNFSVNNPGSLISAINKELKTQRKSESMIFLALPQTFREFSQFTEFKIPESLLQASDPSFNIFTGYHSGSSSVIFLIKIENFEKAYGSLLVWEKDMWQSFSQFLEADDVKNINKFSFGDEIIRNHDSRILKNKENRSILAYAIFNKQFLVITTSREALSIMLQRLIASPPRPL